MGNFCLFVYRFFSRNLKPVMEHKINRCKEFIPKVSILLLLLVVCIYVGFCSFNEPGIG